MAATASVNLMAGVKFTLLGTELTAGFEKNGDVQHIFVYQDVSGSTDGVTVDKLISDVRTLMGKKSNEEISGLNAVAIKEKLSAVAKPGSQFDVNSMRIVLHTVYLDILKPAAGESTVEYAFRLDVIADGLIPAEVKLINVDRITLAVWNTVNERVKKQLAISIESAI